jgi:hypothetical protein
VDLFRSTGSFISCQILALNFTGVHGPEFLQFQRMFPILASLVPLPMYIINAI